jgi:hypothetical protein
MVRRRRMRFPTWTSIGFGNPLLAMRPEVSRLFLIIWTAPRCDWPRVGAALSTCVVERPD